MSLEDRKEKLEWRHYAFECELGDTYDIEIQNGMNCIHN